MVVTQNNGKNPQNTKNSNNEGGIIFSPRFKSVAERAGWDEEALLLASLVVEDTPERLNKRNKRSSFKSPPTNSRSRKRRAQRQNPSLIPVTVLNLDDDDDDVHNESATTNQGENEKKSEVEIVKTDSPQNVKKEEQPEPSSSASCSGSSTLPCIDRLREELSCAICLEICFEPSTTPCGHSFCKKCLRSAADKCGKKCPKCRQLISNGRSCTVNTVLWNTIQLLFPDEVEARKVAGQLNSREAECQTTDVKISQSTHIPHTTRRLRPVGSRRGDEVSFRSRRAVPSQNDDAALALRLQREEFMAIYRGPSLARENLRAMAQRAINNRIRDRAL